MNHLDGRSFLSHVWQAVVHKLPQWCSILVCFSTMSRVSSQHLYKHQCCWFFLAQSSISWRATGGPWGSSGVLDSYTALWAHRKCCGKVWTKSLDTRLEAFEQRNSGRRAETALRSHLSYQSEHSGRGWTEPSPILTTVTLIVQTTLWSCF